MILHGVSSSHVLVQSEIVHIQQVGDASVESSCSTVLSIMFDKVPRNYRMAMLLDDIIQ